MSTHRILQSIHLAAALLSMAFLLAYVGGAVQFAHHGWIPRREYSTVESLALTPGITDARVLARRWRGELEAIDNSPCRLKFRITTPLGTEHAVTYEIAGGHATDAITARGFVQTLAFIHASHGGWAAAAVFLSLALFTLGITGLYLWFRNHASRKVGVVLLLAGTATAMGLIWSMRLG